jgi:hypothetical protein
LSSDVFVKLTVGYELEEYLLRTLQVKKIPFTSYDLASDESAKRLWKRKAPLGEIPVTVDMYAHG